MSKFDDLFGNLATKLIDQTFGTDGTVVRESATYDVTTGDNTRSTTNYAVKISPPAAIKQ